MSCGQLLLSILNLSYNLNINLDFAAERPQNTNLRHKSSNGDSVSSQSEPTWVHEIFQGILTSETRCLNCEAVSVEFIVLMRWW